ncbi:hypothetical protein QN277_006077 [Acacia crassicarpa]|uniref:SKP1 component POZ domain-containing protein n=1 Tax=Acacia crassicarpa TaxID=499986 RepID=A0AAE1IXJ6_9FABA|nr:hypothetical protein QN277_006077 [Acacia crassicarpa]
MTSSVKMVTLRSNGEEFDIPINVASQSKFIKNTLDVVEDSNVVPLHNVNSAILSKVIEYCKKHAEATTAANNAGGTEELKRWDAEFMKLDYDLLFQIGMLSL